VNKLHGAQSGPASGAYISQRTVETP